MSGHSPNPAGVLANDLNAEKVVTCGEHRRPGERYNDKRYRKTLVKGVRLKKRAGPADSNGEPAKFSHGDNAPSNLRPKGGVTLNAYSPLLIKKRSVTKCYVYSWRTTWRLVKEKESEARSGHIVFGLLKLPEGSAARETLLIWQKKAAQRLALRASRQRKIATLPGEWTIVPRAQGGAVSSKFKLPAGHAKGDKQVKDIFKRAKQGRMPTKRQVLLLDPPKPKKKKGGDDEEDDASKYFYALNPYGANRDDAAILVWNLPNRARGGAVIAVLGQHDVFYRADVKPICLKAVVYEEPKKPLALAEAIFVYGHIKKAFGYAKEKGRGFRIVTRGKKTYGWMLASITDGKNQPFVTTLRNQSAAAP